jgi:hypothetical protein
MKLRQSQVWKLDHEYLLVVQVERLAVAYKVVKDLTTREGVHRHLSKKEFCRLLKGAVLMSPPATGNS